MTDRTLKRVESAGWVAIAFLTLMGVAGALGHILDGVTRAGDRAVVRDANIILYGSQFFYHWLNFRTYPFARLAHMVPGLLYMVLTPLQFMPRIRTTWPRFHRANGRFLMALGILLIPSGMIFAFVHPYVGLPEQVPAVFYTAIYLGFAGMGLRAVLARRFLEHREWMIRGYSMGLGIYSIRVWFILFQHLSHQPSTVFFATCFWIGIATNLLIAEIWINISREYAARTLGLGGTRREPSPTVVAIPLGPREQHPLAV